MRLDKYLAECCIGTRKEVRKLVQAGKIKINGCVCSEPAQEIEIDLDIITYENEIVKHQGKKYVMFYKPAGCITARRDQEHKTVMDYVKEEDRRGLFPVGRLDKDTEGLLLFTNDGEFDYYLMNPIHHVEKTYFLWGFGELDAAKIDLLQSGVSIGDGEITKPARLEILQSGNFAEFEEELKKVGADIIKFEKEKQKVFAASLTITEGKKHQVKRMLKAVGCYVAYLKRTAIGSVVLDETLKRGEYRNLTSEEIKQLYRD